MKQFFYFLIPFVFLFSLSQAYLPGTEDLPLMTGLDLVEDPVVFDKMEGRLVTLQAQGDISQKIICEFYSKTLPNLGWKRKTDTLYERDGECLRLSFESSNSKKTLVTFEISPAPTLHL